MTDVLNFVSKGKDDASEALIRARQNVIALSKSISDLSSVSGKQAQGLSKELVGLSNIIRALPAQNKHVEDHAKRWREMRGELREASSAITKEVVPAMRALGIGGLVAGIALEKIIEKTQEVGESSRQLLNFSRQTGYSREVIEDWTGSAKLFGSSVGGMTSTLAGLAKQMQMLKTLPGGGDLYTKLFQTDRTGQGGAVARQLKATMQGKGTDAEKLSKNLVVLLDYLEQTKKVMGEPYTRTLAEQFGLADLVGALRYTKEQREQLFHDLEKLRGEPLPAADVDAYALSTVRLSAAMEGLSKAIYGALLPVLTPINNAIATFLGNNKDEIGTSFHKFLQDLKTDLENIPAAKLAAGVGGAVGQGQQAAMEGGQATNRFLQWLGLPVDPNTGFFAKLRKSFHETIKEIDPQNPIRLKEFDLRPGAGPGGAPIPHGAEGGSIAETGLAVIHKGETLVPEGGFASLHQQEGQRQLEENTHELHALNDKLQRMLEEQELGQGTLLGRRMGIGGGGVTGVGGPGGTGPGSGGPGGGTRGTSSSTSEVPAPPKIEPLPPHPTAAGVPGLPGSPSGPVMTKEQREAAGKPPAQAVSPGESNKTAAVRATLEAELIKQGVPAANAKYAAAAMTGQAISESGLDPNTVHDKGTGFGIYGARAGRRDAMLAWLTANKYPKNSLEGQARYMAIEAMTKYPSVANALKAATKDNIENVNRILTDQFEAPKVRNYDRRLRDTQTALSAARPDIGVTPPPPSQTGPVGPVAGLPGGPSGPALTPEQRKALGAQPPGNALDIPKSSYTPASRGQMEGNAPQQLLLHYTGGVIKSGEQYSRMASGGDAYMTKYNAQLFMDDDGNITRITPYGQITWHAGQANAFSEGMEISTKYGGTNPNLEGSGLNEKQREALKRYYAQARAAGMYPGGVTSHSLAQPGHRVNEGEYEARMLQNMTPEQLVQYSKTTAETAPVTASAPPVVAPASPGTEDFRAWRHNIIKDDPDYKGQDLPTKPSTPAKPQADIAAATKPSTSDLPEPPPKPSEAAMDPNLAAKSGAVPSHASGAWDVLGGLANLHKGEMVLPRGIADIARQGQSLAQGGLMQGKLGGLLGQIPQVGQLSGMAEQVVHKLSGSAALNIHVPEISSALQGGGAEKLFKQVGLNRMLTMPYADQHSAPEQLGQ